MPTQPTVADDDANVDDEVRNEDIDRLIAQGEGLSDGEGDPVPPDCLETGEDDQFMRDERDRIAYEMMHPPPSDEPEPKKRGKKAAPTTVSAPAGPAPVTVPLAEKIEARKYAEEKVTPENVGSKHPQAVVSLRERAEKEHIVANLARKLGNSEIQEADLRAMTGDELENYHSQLRTKVDQKAIDALAHSDFFTDTYITCVSEAVHAGGQYFKRDTTPVKAQLESRKPQIASAIQDLLKENPDIAANMSPSMRLLMVTVLSVAAGVAQSPPLGDQKTALPVMTEASATSTSPPS
ncbi:hypothetical protein PAPYR_11451 [Paratrimastix pyriformis]|uniref:Uncharacterized protein n=1 Tax=Paratrimastix pyriformis TaxID=342808 RepID=A0ABQ8U8L3_9EUKA|nr:hypothetical protein PAPYR_11451 [Paratrimastix pyriformis]